jgi:hypothetical protein
MEKILPPEAYSLRLLRGCNKIYHPEQFLDDNLPAGAGSQKNKKGQTMPIKALFWPS